MIQTAPEKLNRQYHELRGWRFEDYYNGGGFWHLTKCELKAKSSSCVCGGSWTLRQLHTSANLLIAELVATWGNGDGWLVEQHKGETKICAVDVPITVQGVGPDAFCLAGLKALIAHAQAKVGQAK